MLVYELVVGKRAENVRRGRINLFMCIIGPHARSPPVCLPLIHTPGLRWVTHYSKLLDSNDRLSACLSQGKSRFNLVNLKLSNRIDR
jgi:hypothetical protein